MKGRIFTDPFCQVVRDAEDTIVPGLLAAGEVPSTVTWDKGTVKGEPFEEKTWKN